MRAPSWLHAYSCEGKTATRKLHPCLGTPHWKVVGSSHVRDAVPLASLNNKCPRTWMSCLGTCRYFPCTVQWFLERSELQLIRKGWRRRVLRVIEQVGNLNGESLTRAEAWFGAHPFKRSFMMLRLVDPRHRSGQPDQLNQARHTNDCLGFSLYACCIKLSFTIWALLSHLFIQRSWCPQLNARLYDDSLVLYISCKSIFQGLRAAGVHIKSRGIAGMQDRASVCYSSRVHTSHIASSPF